MCVVLFFLVGVKLTDDNIAQCKKTKKSKTGALLAANLENELLAESIAETAHRREVEKLEQVCGSQDWV